MDIQRVKRLRRVLTLHFSAIAFITSILVANNGTGSIFLPALIFLVATSGFVLVDLLEVFYLGQLGSYVGMGIATVIALISLGISAFNGVESDELMSVASLLIYPQCILFFQKKSLRVFEQLAIFLLLQMIVAALINDNLLYGMLLTPMLLAWVSSLVLFARYATMVQLYPKIEEPVPLLYELIYVKFVKPVISAKEQASFVTTESNLDPAVVEVGKRRRWLMSAPLGISAMIFSGSLFYFLPRTGEGTNLAELSFTRSGVPDRMSTGFFGRLLMDPTPVFRLRLLKDGKSIQPTEPPYLRVEVLDQYRPPSRERASGTWYRSANFAVRSRYPKVPQETQWPNRDRIKVDIKSKENTSRVGSRLLVSMPPITNEIKEFIYDRNLMIFDQIGEEHPFASKKSLNYSYFSASFDGPDQIRVTADRFPNYNDLLTLSPKLPWTNEIRKRILRDRGVEASASPFQIAKAIETHFKESGEYSYSLVIPPVMEPAIDPIDDFVSNTKVGICQHYASAMVMMLRQSEIPARVVIGYHPREWNSLGEFFQVRNSDAHAWVEAQFSREDLLGTEHERWLTEEDGYYWVLMDPTPGMDGLSEIFEKNRPLEYAEDLWEDYLSNSNANSMSGAYIPMAAASQDSAARLMDDFKKLRLVVTEWFLQLDFAWKVTLLVIVVGVLPIGLWQLIRLIPKFAPGLAARLGMGKASSPIQQKFYAKCIALLESLRIRRPDSETLREFSNRAYQSIDAEAVKTTGVQSALDALGDLYHRLRFGKSQELDESELRQVEQHLETVELAVKASANRR